MDRGSFLFAHQLLHQRHTSRPLSFSPDRLRRVDSTACWGFVLVISAAVIFVVMMCVLEAGEQPPPSTPTSRPLIPSVSESFRFSLVVSPLLPETNNWVGEAWRRDWYYASLIPMLIPVTFIAAFLNWIGMKFYRHT